MKGRESGEGGYGLFQACRIGTSKKDVEVPVSRDAKGRRGNA